MTKFNLCWASLLAAIMAVSSAQAQTAGAPTVRRLQDITLDNGITLADWVVLPEHRAMQPGLDVGAEAARHVRRYGPYRELLDIVWRASSADALSGAGLTEANAAEKLKQLADARAKLGDWPDLLMASARAHVLLQDGAAGLADLKRWMGTVPLSAPDRPSVVALLVSAEKDPVALMKWAKESSAIAIPARLQRPLPESLKEQAAPIAAAAKCLGPMRTAVDSEVVVEGQFKQGSDTSSGFRSRSVYKVQANGLLGVQTENKDADAMVRQDVFVAGPYGMVWRRLSNGYTSGVLAGRQYDHVIRTAEIECSEPLFPLSVGKSVSVRYARLQSDQWTGKDATAPTSMVSVYAAQYEVISGPLDAKTAAERYGALRLEGRSKEDWRVYEVRATQNTTWREINIPGADLSVFKPKSETVPMLFIDGPNLFLALNWDVALKPGWVMTLRESL